MEAGTWKKNFPCVVILGSARVRNNKDNAAAYAKVLLRGMPRGEVTENGRAFEQCWIADK